MVTWTIARSTFHAVRTLLLLSIVAGCAGPSAATNDHVDASSHPHDAAPPIPDGPPASTSAIQIITEPNGNKGSELAAAIAGAQHSVYMTMYELDSTPLVTALTGRASAGVDVQVILDGSTTNKSFNTPAFDKLMTAGAKPVWSNPAFTYTHEKTVIIDGTVAWIMTMNGNTTSPTDNREYLAIDTDPTDVAEATAIFVADHAMQSITPSGSLVVANANARPKLVQLIDSATTTLDVEGEEFSDTNTNGIVDAVSQAAMRGVVVHVIVSNGNVDPTSANDVKKAGGHVVMTGPTSGNGTGSNPYIHAKAIVVDCAGTTCARGYVGSENFSAGSLGYNRELGVIFDTAAELAKVKTAIDTDFAAGVTQ
jgi:phosphatidylserine/phosphatidylglycerophosphate/cardiolipin synthase-like enzyme